jgi:hypothetical protein
VWFIFNFLISLHWFLISHFRTRPFCLWNNIIYVNTVYFGTPELKIVDW